jgi:acyl carrier protein
MRSTIAPSPAAPPRATLLAELLAWLNQRFAPDGPAIRADTQLFAGGLLDSLRILELIAWTERAIGSEIPDSALRTDNFATPAHIAERFTTDDPDARR